VSRNATTRGHVNTNDSRADAILHLIDQESDDIHTLIPRTSPTIIGRVLVLSKKILKLLIWECERDLTSHSFAKGAAEDKLIRKIMAIPSHEEEVIRVLHKYSPYDEHADRTIVDYGSDELIINNF